MAVIRGALWSMSLTISVFLISFTIIDIFHCQNSFLAASFFVII